MKVQYVLYGLVASVFLFFVWLEIFSPPLSSAPEQVAIVIDQETNTDLKNAPIAIVQDQVFVEQVPEQAPRQTALERERAMMRDALQQRDIQLCDEIATPNKKDNCRDGVFLSQAMTKKSVDICQNITDTIKRQYCRDSLFLSAAQSDKDFAQCDAIGNASLQIQCLRLEADHVMTYAVHRNDCDVIALASERDTCVARFVKNTAQSLWQDSASCDQFGDDLAAKNACELHIAITSAVENTNLAACQVLTAKADRTECLLTSQQVLDAERANTIVASGDKEKCELLSSPSARQYCHDYIVAGQAYEQRNINLCHQIGSDVMQRKCRLSLGT